MEQVLMRTLGKRLVSSFQEHKIDSNFKLFSAQVLNFLRANENRKNMAETG